MKYLLCGMSAILAMAFMVESNNAGDKKEEKAKYTIKEVMAEAHKSGLLKKVNAGTAEKEDREKLAELYKSLVQSTPPKGDQEAWKKTTTEMHKLAVLAIADPEAGKKLKVNCGACHSKFK
jgi:hypothetical protein